MARTLFSPSWYRVAGLRPTLRKQVIIHRHNYRGKPWHIIEERSSEQHHRFKPATYFIIGLMDGQRTVDDIWRAALERLGDEAPSQDDMIGLLAQLHFADLLRTDTSPEANDLFRRYQSRDRQKLLARLSAPFAWKAPLFDPDSLLDRLLPAARWIFSRWGLLVWLLVVGTGITLAALNWGRIVERLAERVLDPWNLVALAVAYPILKVLHELAHAMAVKVWGGRVHDIGVMFILFMPIPYVDASAASGFSSKWRRALVDAAGILTELLVASIALIIWLDTEPSPLRSVLFNIMLIGTVSTVLFNGNPLLKFDGYYILSDIVEIPNLAPRAQRYLAYLFKRYLFGVTTAPSPVTSDGERIWFLIYGPLAAIYRVFLTVSIAMFLAGEYLLVGILLAVWCVLLMGVMPIYRLFSTISTDSDLRQRRPRVIASLAGVVAAILLVLFVIPVPYATDAEAVAVVPENRQVRAAAEGFLVRLLADPGATVTTGTPLAQLSDPTVEAEARVLKSQVASLEVRLAAVEFTKVVDASVVRAELKAVKEDLDRVTERKHDQTVVATANGQFFVPAAEDLPGRFFQRGTVFGYVHDPRDTIIRAVVDQSGMGAIQAGIKRVDVWQTGNETRPDRAEVARMVPGGGNELPHRALSVEGGGVLPLDPRSPDRLRTTSNVFQIDLQPDRNRPIDFIGQRYFVRFEHAPRPLGFQLFDRAREVVLARFGL
jgi:putative peptide zinc metalloprotease protein